MTPAGAAAESTTGARAGGRARGWVAVPDDPREAPVEEPVWLVRAVLVLFFVGFAAFLAREVYGFLEATAAPRTVLYWSAVGVGLLVGCTIGVVVALAVTKRA